MRQVACAVIMAQAGCFVAADSAEMPVLEQLFTRIGASDFLSEGLSTFMVEMQETADMLRAASDRALVILDEVGRGTSTYDGMSLAQAILEFLLTEKKCCMLFATHYHELTQLSEVFPAIKNAHMGIFEKPADAKAPRGSGSEIIFLHRLVQGPASKSYGIHVAKLAGLPAAVTKRAQAILSELESRSRDRDKGQTQLSLLDFVSQEAAESKLVPTLEPTTEADAQWMSFRKELKALDANQLTPLEALNRIAQWQQNLS